METTINISSKLESDGTTYIGFNFNIGKTIWSAVKAYGKYNYVTIKKVSNNPFGVAGTEFSTFAEAISHYKNEKMKSVLKCIEHY